MKGMMQRLMVDDDVMPDSMKKRVSEMEALFFLYMDAS
jgi:hypothetical protein